MHSYSHHHIIQLPLWESHPERSQTQCNLIQIIIIIALLTIMSEDQWGDLECLYTACQAAITDGGLFTHIGVDEQGENERQSENDYEMKTIS